LISKIKQRYEQLKASKSRYTEHWSNIDKFIDLSKNVCDIKDSFVEEPSAYIAVNQASDYLIGVLWGTGNNVFDIVPSKYVLQKTSQGELSSWYERVTKESLYQMNHEEAGFMHALKPYTTAQFTKGNSGIGIFKNPDYKSGKSDNLFIFRNYSVENSYIDEGLNGIVNIIATDVKWSLNRIISEFCTNAGKFDSKLLNVMPEKIKDSYKAGKFDEAFDLVHIILPRSDYNPKYIGKKGTKFVGYWYMDDHIFREEDYNEFPVPFARQIKVEGTPYGVSSGSMLLSTIRNINFLMELSIDSAEKMTSPALGMWNNSLVGDSLLDTSELSVFNQELAGNNSPIFKLFDVGDITPLVQYIIPYLNDKITTAFKVDMLLDFNSNHEMTATETMKRSIIRGKALSGMLIQQKNDFMTPSIKRVVVTSYQEGLFGIEPSDDLAEIFRMQGALDQIIPQAVLDTIAEGKPWFDIRYNNELERLVRTDKLEDLLKVIQTVQMIAPLYQPIIEAVDWYSLLEKINTLLDPNSQVLIGAREFKNKLLEQAKQQQQMMQIQQAEQATKANANQAKAEKMSKE